MTATIHICTSCKDRDPMRRAAGEGGGPALTATMQAWAAGEPAARVRVLPAVCLGPCGAGGRVSLSAPDRWSWVFEGVAQAADVAALQRFVLLWLNEPEGLVLKAKRPSALAPLLIGRIPPTPKEATA